MIPIKLKKFDEFKIAAISAFLIFGFSVLWNTQHFDPTENLSHIVAIGFVNSYFMFVATWLSVVLLNSYRNYSIKDRSEGDTKSAE